MQEKDSKNLSFGQFEFNAAIAAPGGFRLSPNQRLVFAEPGRRQTIRGNAPGNQVLHDGNRPIRRQLPVRGITFIADRNIIGMAVNTQNPLNVFGDFPGNLQKRFRQRVQLFLSGRFQIRRTCFKEKLGLENETIPFNADVLPLFKDFT